MKKVILPELKEAAEIAKEVNRNMTAAFAGMSSATLKSQEEMKKCVDMMKNTSITFTLEPGTYLISGRK